MNEFDVHYFKFNEVVQLGIKSIACCISRDTIAVVREDSLVEIWTMSKFHELRKISEFRLRQDRCVQFAFFTKSDRLFLGCLDGYVIEIDQETGNQIHFFSVIGGTLWAAKCYENDLVVLCSEDGTLSLYDVNIGDMVKCLLRKNQRLVSLDCANDYAAAGSLGCIFVVEISQNNLLHRLSLENDTIVWAVAINAEWIYSGDSTGRVCVWDCRVGVLLQSLKSHQSDILSLVVIDSLVLCAGIDPTVVKLSWSDNKLVSLCTWTYHTHDVRKIACFGEKWIVSGGLDSVLCAKKVHSSRNPYATMYGYALCQKHFPTVTSCKHAVVLKNDISSLQLWLLNGTMLLNLKSVGNKPILKFDCVSYTDYAITRVGELVKQNGKDCVLILIAYTVSTKFRLIGFNTRNGKLLFRSRIPITPKLLTHFSFSSSYPFFAYADAERHAKILDLVDGSVVFDCKIESKSSVLAIKINEEGTKIAVLTKDGHVNLHQKTNNETITLPEYDEYAATCMAFHSSGKRILTGHCNRVILEYDIDKKQWTEFTKAHVGRWPIRWCKRQNRLCDIYYLNEDDILSYGKDIVTVIRCTQPFPRFFTPVFSSKHKEKHGFYSSGEQFNYIIHCAPINSNTFIVCEVNKEELFDLLPPAFKMKKFGV